MYVCDFWIYIYNNILTKYRVMLHKTPNVLKMSFWPPKPFIWQRFPGIYQEWYQNTFFQRVFPRIALIGYQTIILSLFRKVVSKLNQLDSLKNAQDDQFSIFYRYHIFVGHYPALRTKISEIYSKNSQPYNSNTFWFCDIFWHSKNRYIVTNNNTLLSEKKLLIF